MNSIIKQLTEASYNNPIFGKTTYRNIEVICACIGVDTCEVEFSKYDSATCDRAKFIIIEAKSDDIKNGTGMTYIDSYYSEKFDIEILSSNAELLDKYKAALDNRKYTVTFYEYPEYPDLVNEADEVEDSYLLYKKYSNIVPLDEIVVEAPDSIYNSDSLEKWVIENYPEYYYCMSWHNTVGDFSIMPCSFGGLFECYNPKDIATKAGRLKIAQKKYDQLKSI